MTTDPFQFADLLTGHTARLEPTVAPVLDEYADKNLEGQKDLVRKRSHQTADSVEISSPGYLAREIGPTRPDGFAGGWLEKGTSRQSPYPFIAPTSDRLEPAFVRDAAAAVLEDLNR